MNTFRLINVNPKTVGVCLIAAAVVLMSLAAPLCSAESDEQDTVWLSSLDLSKMTVGWGEPQINKSIVGKPLSIAGQKFDKGVGSHAGSMMYIDLRGGSKQFSAFVGVDDEVKGKTGSVEFRVYADGKSLWSSGVMKAGEPARKFL
jgi:alpha-galactosidase